MRCWELGRLSLHPSIPIIPHLTANVSWTLLVAPDLLGKTSNRTRESCLRLGNTQYSNILPFATRDGDNRRFANRGPSYIGVLGSTCALITCNSNVPEWNASLVK